MLASTALEAGLGAWFVARPPRWLETMQPAVAAAALTVGSTVMSLPLSALSRERSRRVGLDTQTWGAWGSDIAKATAIGAPLSGGAGWLLMAGMRRYGDRWWLPGAAGLTAAGVLTLVAGPTLIDPLFNTFEPAEPAVAARIQGIAERAGVKVDRVLVMDASKRTTASNAYVTGLGATKRVVFYDTLLRDFSDAEVDFVVAHEFAHVRHRDVQTGLAIVAVSSPAMMFGIAELARVLTPTRSATPDARAFAPLAVAAGLLAPALGVITNGFSRAIERRADRFAMTLVEDPSAQIDFQKRICLKNVAEPEPPKWVQVLYGSHPTTLERIAIAAEVAASGS